MAASKKPTPIRPPKPITFPAPITDNYLPHPDPDTQRLSPRSLDDVDVLRAFVRSEIKRALDGYSENLYRTLDRSEAEIIEMGPAQFQALMRDVFKEDE